jgi:hypothetical protein
MMRQKSEEMPVNPAPTRRGFPIYDENPSVVGRFPVAMRSRTKNKQQAVMMAPDTGEILVEGTFGFVTEEEVDNEKFVKIFMEGVKQHAQLTKSGMMLFQFVFNEISGRQGKDKDTVMLNHYIALKWNPTLSRATYYRGLNELLEKGFLFHSPAADVYFINIRMIFNGDRMVVVKAYRRKGSALQTELPFEEPRRVSDEL